MLKYILTDIKGKVTSFSKPLNMTIISSSGAPADSFSGVFAVSGRIPEILSVKVMNGAEMIFFGYVDEQTEIAEGGGSFLEIKARSIESILLDNEALPQTYCLPSMSYIFERHFRPLGFHKYIGSNQSYNGELMIRKGMSQWDVLENFCEKFVKVKPYVSADGVIDISGVVKNGSVFLGRKNIISVRKSLKRSAVISDIYARTYNAGGYDTHMKSKEADGRSIRRVRYVNAVNSKGKTVPYVQNIIDRTDKSYENYIIDNAGIISCGVGDELTVEGMKSKLKIKELHFVLNTKGEYTRIYAEVAE